jgi:predicted nucleic acid-binding protein
MSILIDSDIVIEILRGRNQEILERWQALAASDLSILISPVTIAEVGAGARPAEGDAIAELFAPLTCVPIQDEIGRLAGDLLRGFAKSHSLELGDALIAASAIHCGAKLWTRNRKHYPMQELAIYA